MAMDLEDDSVTELSNKKMEELSALCKRMMDKVDAVTELGDKAKKLANEVAKLSEKQIPALMDMMGVSSIVLKTGESVTKKQDWKVGESAPKLEARIKFLKEHEPALLKNEVSANFGKGDDEKAEEFYKLAQEHCENVNQKIGFDTGSFKALLKELTEQGVTIPKDEIGAFDYQKTVIKKKKG